MANPYEPMKCIWFQFTEISIQIIPDKDLCFIFKNGHPIWAGDKDGLIKILKSVHKTESVD
jgi:hypothetical protein